jgi:transcriptional regulator with XRE-family HTH domain
LLCLKTTEKAKARELRAQGWSVREIEQELGVARSSVSLWVRDVVLGRDYSVWIELRSTDWAQPIVGIAQGQSDVAGRTMDGGSFGSATCPHGGLRALLG